MRRTSHVVTATMLSLVLFPACGSVRAEPAPVAVPAASDCGCTDANGNPMPMPQRLYAGAVDKAVNEGEAADALQWLRRSFAAGNARPSQALTDPAFASIRRDPARRGELRTLLAEFACEADQVLVEDSEPGERILVRGRVVDQAGARVAGALVFVFHTDGTGHYGEGGLDESNPRLFAWLRTDDDGRFSYRTIRPGHYPRLVNPSPSEGRGAEGVEQHVHCLVTAAGYRDLESRLGFSDDPFWARVRLRPPAWAAAGTRGTDGVLVFEHQLVVTPS